MNNTLKIIISILICEGAGIIGSIFTMQAIPTWYSTLAKPEFNPPNSVFGPVWIILYLMMGIALFLVWIEEKEKKQAIILFGTQLFLNTIWSIIFFGMKNPSLAFIDIIIMWIAILATIISFYKISKPAAYMMIPYILWVSFATVLNYSIMILN